MLSTVLPKYQLEDYVNPKPLPLLLVEQMKKGITLDGQVIDCADWVRNELQVRPSDDQVKEHIAKCTPEQIWGVSPASRSIFKKVSGLDLPKIILHPYKNPDAYQKLMNITAIHHKTLSEVLNDLGSSGLGRQIEDYLKQIKVNANFLAQAKNQVTTTTFQNLVITKGSKDDNS